MVTIDWLEDEVQGRWVSYCHPSGSTRLQWTHTVCHHIQPIRPTGHFNSYRCQFDSKNGRLIHGLWSSTYHMHNAGNACMNHWFGGEPPHHLFIFRFFDYFVFEYHAMPFHLICLIFFLSFFSPSRTHTSPLYLILHPHIRQVIGITKSDGGWAMAVPLSLSKARILRKSYGISYRWIFFFSPPLFLLLTHSFHIIVLISYTHPNSSSPASRQGCSDHFVRDAKEIFEDVRAR